MRALVTGAAGFIGSHLTERLLDMGDSVLAIDCLTPYYDAKIKLSNLENFLSHPNVEYHQCDLQHEPLEELLDGVDVIYHLAAMPGVRKSWTRLREYMANNVFATQQLIEAASAAGVDRIVNSSSSSVYGDAADYPTVEKFTLTQPKSPYGVTKLTAEQLVSAYARNNRIEAINLRYFTVYGSRQRPDMAIHRLINSALNQVRFPMYGDGSAVRDFTHVDDVVAANIAAGRATDLPIAPAINVAGGTEVRLDALISQIEAIVGRPVPLDRRGASAGDVDRTGGDITMANELLGWEPQVRLADGLIEQVEWHKTFEHNASVIDITRDAAPSFSEQVSPV